MSNILLFNASNSSLSIHKIVLDNIAKFLTGNNISFASTIDFNIPMFSEDIEMELGYPNEVKRFVSMLHSNDIIILSCPEHNGSVPASFKNLYDWGTRWARVNNQTLFEERKIFLVSTSPGSRGGISALTYMRNLVPFHGGNVIASHSIPNFHENFIKGEIVPNLKGELKELVEILVG